MTRPAVFQGSYADLRFIKGRKVAAITVEIPIEAAAAFVDVFGTPNPAAEIPVALARLDVKPEVTRSSGNVFADLDLPNPEGLKADADSQVRQRKAWADLPPSQQAAIRCGEREFHRFLEEHMNYGVGNDFDVAMAVRDHCGVESRADLNTDPAAAARWRSMDDEFFKWQRGAR